MVIGKIIKSLLSRVCVTLLALYRSHLWTDFHQIRHGRSDHDFQEAKFLWWKSSNNSGFTRMRSEILHVKAGKMRENNVKSSVKRNNL